jgi:hypothetical protein
LLCARSEPHNVPVVIPLLLKALLAATQNKERPYDGTDAAGWLSTKFEVIQKSIVC